MKNPTRFNALQFLRYHIKFCHNEDGCDHWRLTEGPFDDPMHISYEEVIAVRQHEIDAPDASVARAATSKQMFRNHLSSLNSYLAFNGKTAESKVGTELLSSFDSRLKDYLSWLTVAPHTKNDRACHLRAWHRTATCLLDERGRGSSKPRLNPDVSPFHQALRHAIASSGEPAKAIAREARTSTSAIQRWLKGAYPNARTLPSLARLERYLGLERDTLKSLLPKTQESAARSLVDTKRNAIPYRERQRQNTKAPYLIPKGGLSALFQSEWQEYLVHKTATRSELKRANRGAWRLLPPEKLARPLASYAWRHGLGCPTAELVMQRLRSFFGYLCLPSERGGLGVPREEAQSLAWFAVPDAVDGYLSFLQNRSGGTVHGGHFGFAALAAALTNASTGYLTQRPDLAAHLPPTTPIVAWEKACAATSDLCREWRKAATDMSRNPQDPIQGLLRLSEPLLPILRAIRKLDEKAAQAAPASKGEATLKRDALLLSMLVANPLRARNYILMTWRDDGTGSLYRREDGQWRIRFGAKDFKNDRGALQTQYDAPLPRSLTPRIEEYLDEYRPRLLAKNPNTPWAFPNHNSEKWSTLNRQVERLTRQFIPEAHAFGPHAVRHIVATDYLRKHPNDFPTVAQLLHDKLETVLRVYAHLKQDDSFGKYEEHLNAIPTQ